MPLDDLQRAVENLRDMIEVHREYLSGDETRTRQVLIDPLLRELGWDVSDPDAVELEYRVAQQRERADYALISNGSRVALIEAKRLGSDLGYDEIMQVLNYANRANIGYVIVTNGDRWEMYEVFKPGKLEDRQLMKLDMSQQQAHKNVLQALAMWTPNLASDGGPSEAMEPVFISPESALTPVSATTDEPLEQQLPDDSPIDGDASYSFASADRRYPQYTKPIRMQICDKIKGPVKNWQDVIHEVVVWLIEEGMLSNNDCPIEIGKWTFIGCEAVNRDGSLFKRPRKLPGNFILQRGLTTYEQWDALKKILKQLNVNLSAIQVVHTSPGQTSK